MIQISFLFLILNLLIQKNDTLYIVGGWENVFNSFDLKKKEMNNNDITKVNCGSYSTTAYIPSPVNEIHIMDYYQHFKFKINNKNVIKVNNDKLNEQIKYPKIIYIESQKQLFIFGGYMCDKIFYYNIAQNSNTINYEWKLHELKMPYKIHDTDYYDVLLGY